MIDRRIPGFARISLLGSLLALLAWAPLGPATAQEPAPPPADPSGQAAPPSGEPAARATAVDPEVAEALGAAIEELRAGRLEEAAARLEALGERTDLPPQVPATLGAVYVELGRAEEAWEALRPLLDTPAGTDPGVLYNAGRAVRLLGRPDVAVALLERSLESSPGGPAARELGLAAAMLENWHEALRHLGPWVETFPEDREARYAAALAAVSLGRPPQAEELLSGLPPEDLRTVLLDARLELLTGEPRTTVELLTPWVDVVAAAEESPLPPALELRLRRTLADAHLALGEAARAAELLAGWSEGRPDVALALAEALYRSGDVESARSTLAPFTEPLLRALASGDEAAFEAARARAGTAARLAREHGRFAHLTGDPDTAVALLEIATRIAPDDRVAWQELGRAYSAAGRGEEAARALERFSELAAAQRGAAERRVRTREELVDPTGAAVRAAAESLAEGRAEAALETVRREAALVPDDPRPRTLETHALLVLGRFDEALAQARATAERFPGSADAAYQLGAARLALDPASEEARQAAEADLRRALELDPDHLGALSDLGVLLLTRGEREEGRALLERVLAIEPGHDRASAALDRLEGRDG